MSGDLEIPADVAERQRQAADPSGFAWVSANAGAGKTKVLTDRVIRLLLAGTPPGRILCLTFTRAAAANMTERVSAELGRWVTLDDKALGEALHRLEGRAPVPARLKLARRLFARAVETPGGLKIDTIHAFCERLLHLAPFEARVPARFAVLDESKADELMAEARDGVLADAARGADGAEPLALALEYVSALAAPETVVAALDCAVRDDRVPSDEAEAAEALRGLNAALGLAPDEDEAAVERAIVEGGLSPAERLRLAEALAAGSKNDRGQADLLRLCVSAPDRRQALAHYRGVFFNKSDDRPKASLATAKIADAVKEALAAEQERVVALFEQLKAARIAARTGSLFTLARAVRARFGAIKGRRGVLDFDDLIERTLAVLAPESAAWILYKLDRGIDHVLIDEAQDTNPAQWKILRRLTEEFTSGAGAGGERLRTLFAVGDPKQSIFSFQGADPRWFEQSRRHWRGAAQGANIEFVDIRLDVSFRSAPAVLRAVDNTFSIPAHSQGLSYEDTVSSITHRSARPRALGHVEMWPIARRPQQTAEPDAWALPVDELEADSPPVATAARVARAVRLWTRTGDESGRIWQPGEILILARKRGPAFFAVIRSLRGAGVPVAGADRFDIGEHIAVLDLVAAGSAALLPENDLALASALKSPLVGLTDDDLMRIAIDRGEQESLAAALQRHAAAGDEAARVADDARTAWRELAARQGAFGFYAALLGPLGGRRRLISRLGGEAADAIDAFLCYAEAAELGPDVSSLASFLAQFANVAHTIKRDLDAGADEVRVMTVHGAKGLEAGLVIVVDGCDAGGSEPPLLPVPIAGGRLVPAWTPGKKHDCAATADARALRERLQMDEHNRLLYVAMTRAKDRLVIAPFFGSAKGEPPAHSWCTMIEHGFATAGLVPEIRETPDGPVEVWRDQPRESAPALRSAPPAAPLELPDWLTDPVPAEPALPDVLRPSRGAGKRAGREVFDPQARLIGTLTHALIERLPALPRERREEAARALVATRAAGLPAALRARIVDDALALLDHPDLARLFGPGSRAEVSLRGEIRPGGGAAVTVTGQIDRLSTGADDVLIADFKTGRPPGPAEAPPAGYVAQLALYRALLEQIAPGLPVRCLIVWMASPLLVELAPAVLDAALAEMGRSPASGADLAP